MSTDTSAPAARTNVATRTGTVHLGRRLADGQIVPACMGGRQVSQFSGGIHLAAPTADAPTCRRCSGEAKRATLTDAERAERKAAQAAERKAADTEAVAARRESLGRRIEWLASREAEMVAAGGDEMLEALRADLAEARADLAAAR